ncbi:MAG: hypothetical protein DHS20C18_54620 [Saprospiraceae bacterium]|nr:MAG: hypothetical protein DHS20C18_54620 [Saprospiraceae bacterium]
MKNSITLLLLLASINLHSQTEYLAGHLSTKYVSDLTLEIEAQLYSDIDTPIDSLTIYFGDGNFERIGITSGVEISELGIIKSTFQSTHTYTSQGTYEISIAECCWSSEGLNTSEFDNALFLLSRSYAFLSPIFFGTNTSPVEGSSINIIPGFFGETLNFASTFFDPDGDSLTLEFIAPYGDSVVANNYLFPDQINPGGNNVFTIEPDYFTWDNPQAAGNYHVAYKLTEYRRDIPIASSYGVSLINIQNPTSTIHSFENKFKIYPNPTNNVIRIEGEEIDKMEVYNLLGERLISQTAGSGEISLSDLPAGSYLISLFQNGRKYSTLIQKI